MNKLFSPLRIKDIQIKNRVVVPPMVCFGFVDEDGIVSDFHLEHYGALAAGGAGLVIVEATCVSPEGRLSPDQLGIWSDDQIEGLRGISQVCHENGAVVLLQIHHAGEKSKARRTPFNINEVSIKELEEIKKQFVEAACRAKKAGFDGVELHGAHGYLLNQMASPLKNHRADLYGGNQKNRLRFALEILEGIQRETELSIIGYRMGGNEPSLSDGIEIARELEAAGVDLLHVSSGINGEVLPEAPEGFPGNWIVYMGSEIHKQVKVPVILVNGIREEEKIAELMEKDLGDLIALGRPLLVDPAWPKKIERGMPPIRCINCKPCKWFTHMKGCPILSGK